MIELNDDGAVPQHVVGLFIKMAEASEGVSNGDILTAVGLLLNHLTDGDQDVIERALEQVLWVATNTYSEPLQ